MSGQALDPGIARAVTILRENGVHTFESCQGGDGHSFAEPTVKLYGTMAAGWRALSICQDYGLPIVRIHRTWDLEEGEPSGPHWTLVFRADA